MVVKYVGKAGWAGMAVEDPGAEGTAVAPTIFVPYEDIGNSDDQTIVYPTEHRGSLDTTFNAIRTSAENKLSLKMDAFPEMGLEHLLYGVFGDKSVTGDGTATPYTHVFEQANVPPTFTFHSGITNTESMFPKVYSNAMLDSFKFSLKEKEQAKVDAEFATAPVVLDTADETPTYSAQDPVPFVFPELKFKWADYGTGATQDMYIQSVDFEIKKNVKTEHTANNELGPSIFASTGFELSGKFSKIFQNLDEYKKFLGSASATKFVNTVMYKNIELEMEGKAIPGVTPVAKYKLNVVIPRVLVTKSDVKYSGDDILKYDFDFRAMKDNVTGKTASATLISKLASIT